MLCYFVSDLHGKIERYEKLFNLIEQEKPNAVFFGGDLLPHYFEGKNFVLDYLEPKFKSARESLGAEYPQTFLIFGNDDAKSEEPSIQILEERRLINYIHFKKIAFENFTIIGYSCIPPSPFLLKDWEKYDVSHYLEPGCIPPEDGKRTVEISDHEKKYSTIKKDLEELVADKKLPNTILLFHCPPYQTKIDRAALDGKTIDHVPLDIHVGSIAIRKFIESKQPLISLNGHIHESTRITGSWNDMIGETFCVSAAYDGKELALIRFDPHKPNEATRTLI